VRAMDRSPWNSRIRRATQLSREAGPATPLITFYATLLGLQRDLYDAVRTTPPSDLTGSLESDLSSLRGYLPPLLNGVAAIAPSALAQEAVRLGASGSELEHALVAYWEAPSDTQFFPKAMLQPYAQCLAERAIAPRGRPQPHERTRCPFCGGAPQVSILRQSSAPSASGGSRELLCSTCLTTWPSSRVLCANCGENDERMLGYFKPAAYEHLRIEACDSCRHYVKSVDLTRLGFAVPLVDEVASAPLDAWARDHGYSKTELNLIGL
jgi:formate dehydrogenase accessory protein FdhE